MKNKPILLVLLLILLSFAPLHKDRIEKPISVDFYLRNGNKILWNELTEQKLAKIDLDVNAGRIKLSKAIFKFETGETLTLIGNGHSWTKIQISFKNQTLEVPSATIKKISEINFSSIALLWSDDSKKAVESKSFRIQMKIGKVKSFGNLPLLDLSFENDAFSDAVIWRSTDENSIQWSDF